VVENDGVVHDPLSCFAGRTSSSDPDEAIVVVDAAWIVVVDAAWIVVVVEDTELLRVVEVGTAMVVVVAAVVVVVEEPEVDATGVVVVEAPPAPSGGSEPCPVLADEGGSLDLYPQNRPNRIPRIATTRSCQVLNDLRSRIPSEAGAAAGSAPDRPRRSDSSLISDRVGRRVSSH
jgi:hypothetical protein